MGEYVLVYDCSEKFEGGNCTAEPFDTLADAARHFTDKHPLREGEESFDVWTVVVQPETVEEDAMPPVYETGISHYALCPVVNECPHFDTNQLEDAYELMIRHIEPFHPELIKNGSVSVTTTVLPDDDPPKDGPLATCAGCGAYGPLGSVHVWPKGAAGLAEECGTFV